MNLTSVIEKPTQLKTTTAHEVFLGDLLNEHERENASLKEDVSWYRWCYEVTFSELAKLRLKHERQIYINVELRYELEVLKGLRDDGC